MRIGCLQFAPQVGDVDNNLNRADAVLSRANPEDLDLLVLPELAFSGNFCCRGARSCTSATEASPTSCSSPGFTAQDSIIANISKGYNFKSLQDITPFLEPSGSGITSLWARTIALKYNCIVTVGYPEKVDVSPKWPTGPEYYNSVIVVNGDGETIANYRKSFLYYTDETWALEGNRGFYEGFIPGLGNTSIGICMDINPYKFEAPWHAFEFAFHILEVESNLVIVSMAWMTREEPRRFTRMPNEPDMETLTYWVTRLEPLIRSENQDEIIVVFCNRSGNEEEALYAGTSAVIGIQDGEVKVYGLLGRGEKELLVVDTNNSPYAKLVYRPEAGGSGMEAPGHLQQNDKADDSSKKGKEVEEDKKNKGETETKDSPSPKEVTEANDSRKRSVDKSIDDKQNSFKARVSESKHKCLPPLPQLPDDLAEDMKPSKRRQAPTISIPKASDLIKANSARSPGTGRLSIPTPSAPSPTPMAIRPRLIIPESPPIMPHQYPPDHPLSAASLRSEKSIRSFKSEESEASSVRTVRTNPRPPEESTPYPDSGAPLSGYPSNFFSSEKLIYGGEVTIQSAGPFSPTTPFEDVSPVSNHPYFWRSNDNFMRTPISGGGWTPGTPIGRRPEPFPWPAITGSQRPASRNGVKDRVKENATPKDLRHLHSLSPQSNTSSNRSNRTSKSHRTTHSASSVNSKGTVQAAVVEDKSLERPSSPKSRNASRSRMHERSDSSLGDRETSAAISQHLENISQRAESVNRLRSTSATTPVAERRVQSPHSRNQSRSRPSEPATSPSDQHTIRIAASPSILSDEGRNTRQSLTRATYHQRSNSFPANNTLATNDRAGTPNSAINMARPASRAASRGRTPGPKVSPTHSVPEDDAEVPPHERASSADSTRNDRLHRRIRSSQSRTRPSRTGRGSSVSNNNNNGRRRSDEGPSEGFERVEAIISPSCPVHGRRPSSNRGRVNEISIPVSRSPPEPSPPQRPASSTGTSQYLEPGQPEPRRASSGDASQMAFVESQKPTIKDTQVSQNEAAEASDCGSVTETLQTISTPGRSPATPYFNPSTPKAMVLNTNDADVEPLFSGNLEGTAKTPTPRCAELDALTPVEVPASSVA